MMFWKELQNSTKKELPDQPKLAYDEEPTERNLEIEV